MRHIDDRHSEFLMQPHDFELNVLAQLLVERAERFVHQQQPRPEHHRARKRHALLLSTRKLARIPLQIPSPTISSISLTRRLISEDETLGPLSGKAMFLATVMCGNKA